MQRDHLAFVVGLVADGAEHWRGVYHRRIHRPVKALIRALHRAAIVGYGYRYAVRASRSRTRVDGTGDQARSVDAQARRQATGAVAQGLSRYVGIGGVHLQRDHVAFVVGLVADGRDNRRSVGRTNLEVVKGNGDGFSYPGVAVGRKDTAIADGIGQGVGVMVYPSKERRRYGEGSSVVIYVYRWGTVDGILG